MTHQYICFDCREKVTSSFEPATRPRRDAMGKDILVPVCLMCLRNYTRKQELAARQSNNLE